MVVTFCGHREVYYRTSISIWLNSIIEDLISQGASVFYLGGCGNFDLIAASVLHQVKRRHPNIESTLILPYLNFSFNAELYDSTIYPPLENVPRRFAIVHRNRWMVQQSDVIITYIMHEFGGAFGTYMYAKSLNKHIISYNEYLMSNK